MIRNIGAGLAGIVVAGTIVWLVEMIGHTIYPTPADLDTGDMDVMRAYVDTVPLGAMLSVALAWFLGSLGGTFAACRIGSARPLVYLLVVGGMMFAGAAFNLTMIPHPIWFSILGVVGIFVGAWLGMTLGTRKGAAA
jgi:hypothetical protein